MVLSRFTPCSSHSHSKRGCNTLAAHAVFCVLLSCHFCKHAVANQAFLDYFDQDKSLGINVTEFEEYLKHLRGDDEDHCAHGADIFAAANITTTEASTEDEINRLITLTTPCVISVACGADMTVKVEDEIYSCDLLDHDHDHDHDDDHDHDHGRRLQEDDHGHDEDHVEELTVTLGTNIVSCSIEEEEETTVKVTPKIWAEALGGTLLTCLASLVGVLTLICTSATDLAGKSDKGSSMGWLDNSLGLALGILLWVTFGHLVPEGAELYGDEHKFGIFFLVGIFIAATVELLWPHLISCTKNSHHHILQRSNVDQQVLSEPVNALDSEENVPSKQVMKTEDVYSGKPLSSETEVLKNSPTNAGATISNILVGDVLHNFVDGVVIGLAFTVCGGAGLGIAVSLGVLAHELPQELSDFLILIRCGLSVKRALFFNFLSSLSAFIGTIVVLSVGEFQERVQGMLLLVSAGLLGFICLAEIFPLMHASATTRNTVLFRLFFVALGFVIGGLLEYIPHDCHEH